MPSGAGWALSMGVCRHTRPAPGRSSGTSAGENWPNGKNAAPRSCLKPGRVTSRVRTAPPGSSFASRTSTERPALARYAAAVRPFGPDPMTIASGTGRL